MASDPGPGHAGSGGDISQIPVHRGGWTHRWSREAFEQPGLAEGVHANGRGLELNDP